MRPADGPQPIHHVTVPMPVEGMAEGWTARVLCLSRPDGVVETFGPLLKYFKAHSTRGSSWQDTAAQALGLLWDYGIATKDRYPDRSPRNLFRDFALALAKGTIATDATDPTGLFWPATPYTRCKSLIKAIEKFAEWCDAEERTSSPISPEFVPLVPQTSEHVTAMLRWSRLRETSMLKHITHAPRARKRSTIDHGPDPRGRGPEPVKFFPPEHAARLLWDGYKAPGTESEPNIFLRYNVRNMMIALLDGWGGLRRSEGLHLWVQDVIEDPNNLEHALVVLNHPSEAKVEFTDPITRRVEIVTRREFLKREHGLLPRHEVTRGAYHAGWKGMDLDREYRACVFWIDPDAGALFWVLYWGYLNYVRTPIMAERIKLGGRNHPFLFVSARGDESGDDPTLPGEPYSEAAYERAHEAAVKRIGLAHRKYLGTTTHGLRHLYGQTMQDLGVPPQVIKKGLHHRNYLSQAPYTVPDNAKTNQKLREAQEKIVKGEIRAIAPIAESTAEALLKISEFVAGGGSGGRY
ncbi:hypothetical protein [Bradyrhizobium sp. USDA 10063]